MAREFKIGQIIKCIKRSNAMSGDCVGCEGVVSDLSKGVIRFSPRYKYCSLLGKTDRTCSINYDQSRSWEIVRPIHKISAFYE